MDHNAKTLVRAVGAEPARLADVGGKARVDGLMAPTGTWVEIDSVVESRFWGFDGKFLECIAPGAFTKTITENGDRVRAIFHHGRDSSIGFKVLGPVTTLEEGDGGVRYQIELLPTSYNDDLKPGIEAGLYGTSFKGTVTKRDINRRPPKSAENPKGLPEVTYTEILLHEFGLTPLPVYEGTTATMRSLLDDELSELLGQKKHSLSTIGGTISSGSITATPINLNFDRSNDDDKPYGLSRSRYNNALRFVGDTAWAMTPSALATILGIIGERSRGYKPSLEEIRERVGVERATPDASADSPVRVINVSGPIFPRADLFTEMSGAASVEGLQSEFRDALASEDVKSILLNIDSPGGAVNLIPEFAQEIRDARGEKPIVAVANTMAASAAYWLASAVDELYVTPSGEVGSIGVYTAHDDVSAMQEKLGVTTTLVSAGDYKTEGNPYEPLTEEAQAEMQRVVDAYYGMFVDAVAKGRGTTAKNVKETFGQGRMVLAPDAVSLGMADGVASFDQTLARLEKSKSVKRSADIEPERSVATTRLEPEPSAATTRKAPTKAWGTSERPYWMR